MACTRLDEPIQRRYLRRKESTRDDILPDDPCLGDEARLRVSSPSPPQTSDRFFSPNDPRQNGNLNAETRVRAG